MEPYMFDVTRFIEAHQALGEGFDMLFRKNEAMIGRLPGNAFVLMEFQEGGGVFEVAAVALRAVGLNFAEVIECLSELAGEALAVHAESGEGAVGVDDVEVDSRLIVGRVGGAVEERRFEQGDAV